MSTQVENHQKAKVRYLWVVLPDQVPALQSSGGDFRVSSMYGRVSPVGLSRLHLPADGAVIGTRRFGHPATSRRSGRTMSKAAACD